MPAIPFFYSPYILLVTMLEVIISSKTRIKLLIKFFLFDGIQSYLRKMEKEFNESTNGIRVELNKFIEAGLLISEYRGKKRYYRVNPHHILHEDLQQMVRKSIGIPRVIEGITSRLKNLEAAYVTGKLASGINSETIELALVMQHPDKNAVDQLVKHTEKQIDRKIMYLILTKNQMDYFFKNKPAVLIWKKEI
jgi:DNA-binding transcriptional ArsR family regulator